MFLDIYEWLLFIVYVKWYVDNFTENIFNFFSSVWSVLLVLLLKRQEKWIPNHYTYLELLVCLGQSW